MHKEKMIIEIIAWNMDYDKWDYEDGEQSMIGWIIDTYKYLNGQTEDFLRKHMYANSLQKEEDE